MLENKSEACLNLVLFLVLCCCFVTRCLQGTVLSHLMKRWVIFSRLVFPNSWWGISICIATFSCLFHLWKLFFNCVVSVVFISVDLFFALFLRSPSNSKVGFPLLVLIFFNNMWNLSFFLPLAEHLLFIMHSLISSPTVFSCSSPQCSFIFCYWIFGFHVSRFDFAHCRYPFYARKKLSSTPQP